MHPETAVANAVAFGGVESLRRRVVRQRGLAAVEQAETRRRPKKQVRGMGPVRSESIKQVSVVSIDDSGIVH